MEKLELGYNGVEIVGQVFQKVNTELSEDKAIAVLGDIDSIETRDSNQYLYVDVHSISIYNSLKSGMSVSRQISISRQVDK